MPDLSTDARIEAEIDLALARSIVYGTLGLGLQPPAGEPWRRLSSEATRHALAASAVVLQAGRDAGGGLAEAIADFGRACLGPRGAPVARYQQLFGHTARGVVCPFETEYGQTELFRQPQDLADIAGYYLAFGLEPAPGGLDRVDHVACECEFMDFLCRKQAYLLGALQRHRGEPESLDTTRRAEVTFLRDHLARFGLALATKLVEEDGAGWYGRLGTVLSRFLTLECAALGIHPGPRVLALRSAAPDQVPMACGSGEELIQVQGLGRR